MARHHRSPGSSKSPGNKEVGKDLPYGSYAPLSGQRDDGKIEKQPEDSAHHDEDDTLSSGRDKLHE